MLLKNQQATIGNNQFKACSSTCVSMLIILLCLVQLNQGQFFTKSSSKSIPRMGRRSVGDENELTSIAAGKPMSPYRRSLIDALIDEYGPSLLENLQRAKAAAGGSGGELNKANNVGEIALRNEQPFDVNPPLMAPTDDEQFEFVQRDERSSPQQPYEQPIIRRSNGNYQDLSLALRALNTKRYLQQLSSSQPLGGGGVGGLLVAGKVAADEQQHIGPNSNSNSNSNQAESD